MAGLFPAFHVFVRSGYLTWLFKPPFSRQAGITASSSFGRSRVRNIIRKNSYAFSDTIAPNARFSEQSSMARSMACSMACSMARTARLSSAVALSVIFCKDNCSARDSVHGTEVAFHYVAADQPKRCRQIAISPGLPGPFVVGPRNSIIWRPRCTDSPVLCWRA
jgi:hypothetical protein